MAENYEDIETDDLTTDYGNRMLRKWVDALESPKYRRGKTALHVDGTYCPLGVLCEIAGLKRLKADYPNRMDPTWKYVHTDKSGQKTDSATKLPTGFAEELGLHPEPLMDIPTDVQKRIGLPPELDRQATITSLNDTYGVAFNVMAEIIRYTFPETFDDEPESEPFYA